MVYNLGKFVLTPRGGYSPNESYDVLDFVLYNGSSYVCKSNGVSDKVPTNTTYWQLLANAGQPTMTEAQKQEIISTLLASGVIIDPDYNTYSTEEKDKLAGLSVPNNGTLSINYDGRRIAQFSANQSTNTTANIPSPNNAVITLYNRETNELIDKFTVDQKENQDIYLPVGSGGGGSTGTLTLKVDGSIVGTWDSAADGSINVPIGSGTLTIQRNGSTLGTFSANADSNSTIDIAVPTSVNDLADGASYAPMALLSTVSQPTSPDDDLTDVKIAKLTENTVYVCDGENAQYVTIEDFAFEISDPYCLTLPPTYIYITPSNNIDISAPSGTMQTHISSGIHLTGGTSYMIEFRGYIMTVFSLT